MPLKRFAVMVSGGGTDLQSIIDSPAGKYIALVISSKEGVYSLERCKKAGIPSCVIAKKDYADKEAFDGAILKKLEETGVNFVVLAGYLQILGEKLVEKYENRIINIHPALIPSFCGKGYYGLKVHQAAIDYGVKLSGATVHFVNALADNGPVIMQEAVKVEENDTAETLQARILEVEHRILPEAVMLMCEDRIKVNGRHVTIVK